MAVDIQNDDVLFLAAEECPEADFSRLHCFSKQDERAISKLMAHGPVLLRGGRGSGKSALMLEAARRMSPAVDNNICFGLYLSLRHLPLLRATDQYEEILCRVVIDKLQTTLATTSLTLHAEPNAASLQHALASLSADLEKRIVVFFDDAAHIGRETSLSAFFDVFRTLSSSTVSCKAAIYPGVTRFGTRFDVFNDASVIDIVRSEESPDFGDVFFGVMEARFPNLNDDHFSRDVPRRDVAKFLGQSILGNMRAFVFACDFLSTQVIGSTKSVVGLSQLGETLLTLASNHFWPMLDELRPKLGMYERLIEPSSEIAEKLFMKCGKVGKTSALVHRDITERLAKPFEILEYAGFIVKREASRSLKSGGRGARYGLNLCNLLEQMPGKRLTQEYWQRWGSTSKIEPIEFDHGSVEFKDIHFPQLDESAELGILSEPIETLKKSNAYPYGLTQAKLTVLEEAGFVTVGGLANATDEALDALRGIGPAMVQRIRNIAGQAIWM